MNFKEFIKSVYKLNEMYCDNSALLRVKMYALVHTYHKDIIGKVIFIGSDNVNDVIKECLPLQTPVVITNVYPSFKSATIYPISVTRLKCCAIRIRYKHLCVNYAHDDNMELRVSSMAVTSGETKDIALCEDLISYIKDNVITPAEAEERLNVKYSNFKNYLYLEVN